MSETTAPDQHADPAGAPSSMDESIIDTILDLDVLLSAEVRRARRTAYLVTEPHRQGLIDALEEELSELTTVTDWGGLSVDNPTDPALGEPSLGEPVARTAYQVAQDLREERQKMAASRRAVVFESLTADEWEEFRGRHREAIESENETRNREVLDDLVSRCAIAPKLTPEQVGQLRERFGHAAMENLRQAARSVCMETGVSIPKSPISSAVLRLQAPDES